MELRHLRFVGLLLCLFSLAPANPDEISTLLPVLPGQNRPRICNTPTCHRLSALLKKQIDLSADPCEDFHQFACGKFVAEHPLKDIEAMLSDYNQERGREDAPPGSDIPKNMAREIIRNVTREAIEAIDYKNPDTPQAFKYAKLYLESCTTFDRTSEKHQMEVAAYVKDFASWPFFHPEDWTEDELDVADVVGRLHGLLSIESFFRIDIEADASDSEKPTVGLGPPLYVHALLTSDGGPDLETMQQRQIVRAFKTLAINAGTTIKGGMAALKTLAEEITNFEEDIADFLKFQELVKHSAKGSSNDSSEEQSERPVSVTLKELDKLSASAASGLGLAGGFWKRLFSAAFRHEPEGMSWLKKKDATVQVEMPEYLKFLSSLLEGTDKRLVANFLLWKLMEDLGPEIGENYRDPFAQDQNIRRRNWRLRTKFVDEPPTPKKTKRDCFTEVERNFRDVVTKLYIDRRYGSKKEKQANDLVKRLVEAASETFDESEWLSDDTKSRLKDKLGNIVLNIGYPQWINNITELDHRYGKWKQIESNVSYFQNSIKFNKWNYKKLFIPVDKHEFRFPPTYAGNAYFDSVLNAMVIPAGTFEYPFYDEGYADSEFTRGFSFGQIGALIGHELFHAFDSDGIRYDRNGKDLENSTTLLHPDEFEKFLNLSTCLVNEFSKACYDLLPSDLANIARTRGSKPHPSEHAAKLSFQSPLESAVNLTESQANIAAPLAFQTEKACVKGERTIDESLTDFNGLHAAWKAWKKFVIQSGPETYTQALPDGLNRFDADQLFFLGYSALWCRPYNPLTLTLGMKEGTHAPPDARLNLGVKHLPAFARAFECKAGAKMNPNPESLCHSY